jgi:peroxiredoxin
MAAETGQQAPDFTLPDQSGTKVSLGQFSGEKNLVLSFYVFDFTGG